MRRTIVKFFTFVLLLALAGPASTQTVSESIQMILDKGTKSLGGEANLTKLAGLTLKGKGIFYEGKNKIPFSGTWYTQGSSKTRFTTVIQVRNLESVETTVVNGDKGWVKGGKEQTKELDKEQLAEEKENLYFNSVTLLAPLKGKNFKLGLLPSIKIDGKVAVGINVAAKGHRDIKLYLDKETGLPLRAERKVRDLENKKDVTEETTFTDYKEINGIKVAMKYSVKRDGKPHADAAMTEAKVQEKLDDKLFGKP
jgi:hypothetical protein